MRVLFAEKLADRITLVAQRLPQVPVIVRERRAAAIVATMIGARQLVRSTSDPELSAIHLQTGAETAYNLAATPD
ncbi:hypothetical protein [Ancylobacter sp. IITR112]|uniref:hypothetical protein n=1 Tax=Ancylobacter sp. IITR112 TaxID=3138073 RepID=UPI00352A7451